MLKRISLTLTAAILWAMPTAASDITKPVNSVSVYIESANSLVNDKGDSLGAEVLKEVEKISELRFSFTQATYSRALYDLKSRKADLVLHVPYQYEPGFEEYGLYLDWTVPVKADLYTLNPEHFVDLSSIGDKRIAIPRGNINFASEITGIPAGKFFEVNTIRSMVKMLAAKRIDMIWFERTSVRNELKRQKIPNVYFYEIPEFGKRGSISIGLQKTPRGEHLKNRLETLLSQLDVDTILAPYYQNLQQDNPKTGLVIHPQTNP